MVRIGVNIPNELMKRLEPLKPELNISKVCRDALEAKAASYERMQARLANDAIWPATDRLLEQEMEFLAAISFDWQELGWGDAASWVGAASHDDWNDFLEEIEWLNENNWPHWKIMHRRIDGVKHFHERTMELRDSMKQAQQKNPGFDRWLHRRRGGIDYQAIEQEYMTAWTAYVSAVWERYRQSLSEYLERLNKERLETWRNRHLPEVPENLVGDAQSREEPPFQAVPHHAAYAPGIDPLKLNHLIGDLDVAEFLGKQERRE